MFEALKDADVILMVTDIYEDPNKMEQRLAQINKLSVPILLLLNKIDNSEQKTLEKLVNEWKLNYLKQKFYLFPLYII